MLGKCPTGYTPTQSHHLFGLFETRSHSALRAGFKLVAMLLPQFLSRFPATAISDKFFLLGLLLVLDEGVAYWQAQ